MLFRVFLKKLLCNFEIHVNKSFKIKSNQLEKKVLCTKVDENTLDRLTALKAYCAI